MIPVIIGLLAASYLVYNSLNDIRFEPAIAQCGNYDWVDGNGNKKIDVVDPADFKMVGKCQGEYVKRTYKDTLSELNWTFHSTFWIFMAVMSMAMRNAAYIYRIRQLTDKALTWGRGFKVIMLWEFATSIAPSIIGGSGLAAFILKREGIPLGKSTAIVMITALLDELFFITVAGFILILVGTGNLFPMQMNTSIFGINLGIRDIFLLGYANIVFLTSFILFALIYKPRIIKYWLLHLFRLRFLRRWRYAVIEFGNDLIITSTELKSRPIKYWIKPIAATYFAWSARFMVINFLILSVSGAIPHFLVYARQMAMWVIMLISPTPGNSGVAELAFSGFLKEFIPVGLSGALAIIWRLISYYFYLFAGAFILPRWLKETAPKKDVKSESI